MLFVISGLLHTVDLPKNVSRNLLLGNYIFFIFSQKKNLKNLHASLHQCFHINFQFSILFELYLLHSVFYEFSYCFCIIYSGMYKDMYIFIILVLSHCYDILTGDFLLSES